MILKFPTSAARAAFLDRISNSDSGIAGLAKPSYSQPTVVIVRGRPGLSDRRLQAMVTPHLDGRVEVFDDVQFSVLAPSR